MAMDVQEVTRVYENALPRMQQEWSEMIELFDYSIGAQWTEEEKTLLKKWGRIPRVYDIVTPQLIAYDGYLVQSETQPKAVPWESGDNEMADIHTQLLQKSLRDAQFSKRKQRAATDAWIARRGRLLVQWNPDSERYSDGELEISRLHPLSVVDDLDSSSPEPDSGRYKAVREWRSVDTILSMYGMGDSSRIDTIIERAAEVLGKDVTERGVKAFFGILRDGASKLFGALKDKALGTDTSRFNKTKYSDYVDVETGHVLTIELHYRERVKRKRLAAPGIRPIPIEQEMENDREFIGSLLQMFGADERAIETYMRELVSMCVAAPGLFDDMLLLDPVPYAVQTGEFMIFTYSAYDFHPDAGHERGGLDYLRHYADRINRLKSSQEDAVNRALNPQWKMRDDSLPKEQEYLTNWKEQKPGDVLVWRGEWEPKKVEMGDIISLLKLELDEDLNFAQNQLGIGPNMRGINEGEKSGIHFQRRVQQGEIMQNTLFKNIRETDRRIYKYAHALIQKHMHAERIVRLTAPGGQEEYNLRINAIDPLIGRVKYDITAGDYDIEFDETHMSATARQMRFEEMSEFMQYIPDAMKFFMTGPWIKLSELPQQDVLLRAWRTALLMQFGPDVLAALENDGALERLMQQYTMMNQMSQYQSLQAGGAVPEGAPDPHHIQRAQYLPEAGAKRVLA